MCINLEAITLEMLTKNRKTGKKKNFENYKKIQKLFELLQNFYYSHLYEF